MRYLGVDSIKKELRKVGMVVHTFNPRGRGRVISIYSRQAWCTLLVPG